MAAVAGYACNLQGSLLIYIALLSVAVWLIYLLGYSARAGLSHIPGPFLARYTDAWSLYSAWNLIRSGGSAEYHKRLQERYGDVIRVGPRTIVVLDPAAVPLIYGVRARLDKGPAYIPFRQAGVTTSLLSMPDEKQHTRYRKLISHAYSMSSLKEYEPYVDDMVNRMVEVCNKHAETKVPLNISLWCYYYCYDVVSKVTLGTPLGFMAGDGQDVNGLIKQIKSFGPYTRVVSHMPWLHSLFQENIIMRKMKPSIFLGMIHSTVMDRLRITKQDPESQKSRPDLLSHFVATHATSPLMDTKQVMIFTSGNLIAGGLSPGRTFHCLCQFLATHPDAQAKLYAELSNAKCNVPTAFDDVKDLPYLEGVVREAYRLHNDSSFQQQRVAGPEGLTLPNGIHVPSGTLIGCPPDALNRDERIWGPDTIVYRPERWLRRTGESEEAYQERRKNIEKTELTFGQGSRTCMGKSIATLEIFKVVATLMLLFQFELVGEGKEAEVFVRVHRRERPTPLV